MSRDTSSLLEAINIVEILRRIPRNRRITAEELRQALAADGIEISTRTMQRTLKTISECGRFDVECDTRERPYGYRRIELLSNLGLDTMTPSEALLLRLVEERMRFQLPPSISKGLSHLYDEAKAFFSEGKADNRKKLWQKKVCYIPASLPQVPAQVKPRIFDVISEALYLDVKINLTYINSEEKKTKAYVMPLGLVQQDSRLYLVCQFDGFDNYRHLALHRICQASLTTTHFARPKNFSLASYVADRHFNYSNGEKVNWVVEFENDVMALNLKETPFNATQKLTKTRGGLWKLEVVIEDSIWLDGWVAAYKNVARIKSSKKTKILKKSA